METKERKPITDMLKGQAERRIAIGDFKTALKINWIELAYVQNASETLALEASVNAVVGTC